MTDKQFKNIHFLFCDWINSLIDRAKYFYSLSSEARYMIQQSFYEGYETAEKESNYKKIFEKIYKVIDNREVSGVGKKTRELLLERIKEIVKEIKGD
jgi:fructose-1,6-bisphosphatase